MIHPDADIKIYTGEQEDTGAPGAGEESAAEYVAHRENGNLEKTRQMGELLAQTLVGDFGRLEEEDFSRQKLLLLSFLALDELEGHLADSILQKSAVAAMNRRLEELSPEIHDIVTDSTAFTLYILNDRQGEGKTPGQVMAQICGQDGNQALAARGDKLTHEYRKLFAGIITSYSFKSV